MTKVVIKNEGQRDIIHTEGVLSSGQFAKVDASLATKLQELYPSEVVSLDDIHAKFDAEEKALGEAAEATAKAASEVDEPEAEKTLEEMSKPELVEKATMIGADFSPTDKKEVIVEAIRAKLASA